MLVHFRISVHFRQRDFGFDVLAVVQLESSVLYIVSHLARYRGGGTHNSLCPNLGTNHFTTQHCTMASVAVYIHDAQSQFFVGIGECNFTKFTKRAGHTIIYSHTEFHRYPNTFYHDFRRKTGSTRATRPSRYHRT